MIKRKNRTHANYKRNNSMRIKRIWQELRHTINKEIETAHNNYVNNLIGDIKQDSKPFWEYINNQKADKQGIPPLKTHDNKTADTDQQKAEALNTQSTSRNGSWPILFLVHINDIAENVTSELRLFADDCVCYREIKNEDDCAELQKDIDTLGNWATNWGMRFQPIKCNMMTLSRKKKITSFKYTLKNTELQFLTSIKYLGVNITNDLHWGKHTEEICNKSYRTLGLLKRNLSACPLEVKLQAYKGLIRPVLEYASTAWD
ncbi:unnamed protein product [Mytilus coruscus]|uniref:Reverse transcriptase domain-containing protein n=1 Tax=Mytilus coruscus TaxID=42192 RepID=A0A6J8DVH0_MYTCO|nr:unnamed protein product [Mytilus coruscus]